MTFSINEVLVLPKYSPKGQESSLIYNSWGKSTKPSHEPMTVHTDITVHTEYCVTVCVHTYMHTQTATCIHSHICGVQVALLGLYLVYIRRAYWKQDDHS